jgi:putative flippase GtrA
MHAMKARIVQHWPRHREKVKYLIVGGWNSFFSYACFSTLYYALHERLAPSVILAIAYVVSSVNGYLTFRHFVFAPVRHPLVEYVRYQAVYLPILAVNMIILPVALTYTGLNAYAIQALFAVFAIVASYLGNKYFAFRKPKAIS